MRLIAFDGSFQVKGCCARPENRVRYATLTEIVQWINSEQAWQQVFDAAPEDMREKRWKTHTITVDCETDAEFEQKRTLEQRARMRDTETAP